MLLPIGINKLSDISIGLLVKISKSKNANVKITAQGIPIKKKHIIKQAIIPAIEPSQDFSLFHLILVFPNLIPI
jgi:hypothetical protein